MNKTTFQEILNQLPAFISDTNADLETCYDWVSEQVDQEFASDDVLYDQFCSAFENSF